MKIEKQEYNILKRPFLANKIVAAYGNVVILLNTQTGNNTLTIYPNYNTNFFKYKVKFNAKNFPGLIEKSSISHCMALPFMRNVKKGSYVKSWRLVIVTDKGQVYHNFPARNIECDGYEVAGDIIRFEESAVWDLPGRLYPSMDKKCDPTERYFPGLPNNVYEFHPMLNTDSRYLDLYNNGGFGKKTTVIQNGDQVEVSRFYLPLRESQSNPFYYMGGFEPDYKINLIGTYRSNTSVGVRICVFATHEGGRNWYCKYEFGDYGEYEFRQGNQASWGTNFGNSINSTVREDDYKALSFKLIKRNVFSTIK